MEHDEIYEDSWGARVIEWLPFVKKDVITTAFCYARYAMSMERLTNFGMKNSLMLPSLAKQYFNRLRDENDEPVYTYTYRFMTNFVRNSIKGGERKAFIHIYKIETSVEVFFYF